MTRRHLSWIEILRLGLVQSALGAMVAMGTSTLNRVMVVEYGLAAMIPAALVAWHYAIQLSRPRWGHGSDSGARRTPWIIGGMGVLAMGTMLAADSAVTMAASPLAGGLMGVVAYTLIGMGVGAGGTSLLALLAAQVTPARRPAAAASTWILMILGIVVSSVAAGALIEPFSAQRLALVVSGVCLVALLVVFAAVWGVERPAEALPLQAPDGPPQAPRLPFREALAGVLGDPVARHFTLFVFVAMLAYSAQDLILEPFAGLVFDYSVGQSTSLSGTQHGGVLLGMILVGAVGSLGGGHTGNGMRAWTLFGCAGSALALGGLSMAAGAGIGWPLQANVFALGFFNGVFAVAAIGAMMSLAGAGQTGREGIRMGVWGAAQAVAFGIGGFSGAAGLDLLRGLLHADVPAFSTVFALEAGLFVAAAALALWIGRAPGRDEAGEARRAPALPSDLALER